MDAQLQYEYNNTTQDLEGAPLTVPEMYLNLFRDLSWSNAKNYEVSDKDGHVMGVLADIHIQSNKTGKICITGAANTWKLRNAFRKFHAYREHMFNEAGVTKSERGPYGRTLRPYLDKGMAYGKTYFALTLDPVWVNEFAGASPTLPMNNTSFYSMNNAGNTPVGPNRGDWIYTRFATVAPTVAGGTSSDDADEWNIHILEDSISDGSNTWSSVGMISAYNQDRMEVAVPDAASTIAPLNPLASLRNSGNTAVGEILDIAEDLELEEPPYDRADAGDSVKRQTLAFGQILASTTTGMTTLRNVFIPAGLCSIAFSDGPATADILVDVNAVVRCKDVA